MKQSVESSIITMSERQISTVELKQHMKEKFKH